VKTFAGRDIVRFLKAIDDHLKGPFRIEMIGGAVALVCFKGTRGTLDIDTTGSVEAIAAACEGAKASTGLNIPVQTAVWDAPNDDESRLRRLTRPKLGKLQGHVPEKHDWAS